MQFQQAVDHIFQKLTAGLSDLAYHNIDHVKDVYSVVSEIARQEQVSEEDTLLLMTAAAYHDAGFLICRAGHEEESCRISKENLPGFGYNAAQIEKIVGMICATRIAQSPKNHLEEILADADLDYLGRDDFYTTGDKLYQELLTAGTINDDKEWHELQIRFLESHHYFTKTSIAKRSAKKKIHLQQIKAK